MNKTELNAANLASALIPFLNTLGQERTSIVLSVFRNGWTLGREVRRYSERTELTSAANYSNAYTVASRLLAS